MTFEQKHKDKVITYIVLGIVAVILVAFYVYIQLTAMQAGQQNIPSAAQNHSSSGVIILNPQQVAAKSAAVSDFNSQKPQALSKSQAEVKAAAIAAFKKQNGGN